jgi:hypothetical protein
LGVLIGRYSGESRRDGRLDADVVQDDRPGQARGCVSFGPPCDSIQRNDSSASGSTMSTRARFGIAFTVAPATGSVVQCSIGPSPAIGAEVESHAMTPLDAPAAEAHSPMARWPGLEADVVLGETSGVDVDPDRPCLRRGARDGRHCIASLRFRPMSIRRLASGWGACLDPDSPSPFVFDIVRSASHRACDVVRIRSPTRGSA